MIGFRVNELSFRSGPSEVEPLLPRKGPHMRPVFRKPTSVFCWEGLASSGAMASAAPLPLSRLQETTETILGPGARGASSKEAATSIRLHPPLKRLLPLMSLSPTHQSHTVL